MAVSLEQPDLLLQNALTYRDGAWRSTDIAVTGDDISLIADHDDTDATAAERIDLGGSYLSPGWVDLHTHLLPVSRGGVGWSAAKLGYASGVTALADAGSVGAANFPAFHESVVRCHEVPVYSFLNIKQTGIRWWKLGREEQGLVDLPAMERLLAEHGDVIKGLKVLAGREHLTRRNPLGYFQAAIEAGRRLGLPVMVHIGLKPPGVEELLPQMGEGTILTHCFRNGDNCILDGRSRLSGEFLAARERGMALDVGHGIKSFAFAVAEQALEQGVRDFTISSDLYLFSRLSRARSFAGVLSKFLNLGLTLEEVMARASTEPARVLGLRRELVPGAPAVFTVFRLERGSFVFDDCWGHRRISSQRIVPERVVVGRRVTACRASASFRK
jgi:dihydroorotase